MYKYVIYFIINSILVVGCSSKTQKIVYFKEPRYKGYETSNSHIHGKMWSPHYIPIKNDEISHILVDEYDKMYKKHHHRKANEHPSISLLLSYLLSVVIVSGLLYLLI